MAMVFKKGPGTRQVELNIKNLQKATTKGIRQAFYAIGKDLRATAKKDILAKPRSGRRYIIRRHGRLRIHIASLAGEAPASLSGTLWRSLDFKVRGADHLEFGYRGSGSTEGKKTLKGVSYGKHLELGTKKMAARPALKLSIKQNERNAEGHFDEMIQRELKK